MSKHGPGTFAGKEFYDAQMERLAKEALERESRARLDKVEERLTCLIVENSKIPAMSSSRINPGEYILDLRNLGESRGKDCPKLGNPYHAI